MSIPYEKSVIVHEAEKIMEYRKWIDEIPQIQFPKGWKITVLPPFGGAVVRFRVNNKVSVYLDCYDNLGYMGRPYWEIYPYDDDTMRYGMSDVEDLIKGIKHCLRTSKEK